MPKPCVVLIVDDNPGDSTLLDEALRFVGFDGAVVSVEGGPQAFSYLAGREPYLNLPRPHLIMLDLNMPVMNGFDVLRELKSHPQWSDIPVFILSSSRNPADVDRAMRLGARLYVPKPLDWDGYVGVGQQVQQACCEAA